MANRYKSGEDFLNKKYSELFFSDIVESIKSAGDTRDEALKKYLDLLEKTHTKVYSSTKESARDLLRSVYHSKYVIKEKNIKREYLQFLNQQYINQTGFEMDEKLERNHINAIIKDQETSLDKWIDYLSSEDSKFYPMWAKYWAFQGMLTIGAYDNKAEIYKKRTKYTVAPFIDLNQEILAKCIDYLVKYIELNEIEEKKFEQLITSGNFFRLYTGLLSSYKENNYNKNNTKGIWKKYDQGENYQELYNSLQGYGTGWCTAGEETCKQQIKNGDFYVYYTYDENGNPIVPRIAIRMDGKTKIGEVRGVDEDQNLEPYLEDVLEEKLKELPDGENYNQKIKDQKALTIIYDKHKNKEQLLLEDLLFLYEINREIEHFGYGKDPMIGEILSERNLIEDFSYMFNPIKNEKAILNIEGSLNLWGLTNYQDLELPQSMKGTLILCHISSAKGLKLPEEIGGNLDLRGLVSAEGLQLPKHIGGNLDLSSLTSAEGLQLPKHIGGNLDLSSLTSAEGLNLPETLGGNLVLKKLISAKDLKLPQTIRGSLDLRGLISPQDLKLPQTIRGSLDLNSLASIEELNLPEEIGGSLNLSGLTSAEGLELPKKLGGLILNNLISAKGLNLPKKLEECLSLKKLISAENLKLPEEIGSHLNLSSLMVAEYLQMPHLIKGSLYLNSLTDGKGLLFPEQFKGSLQIAGRVKNLVLPKVVEGDLFLNAEEGLVLPEKVGGNLSLRRLTSAVGLQLPREIGNYLFLNELTSAEGLNLPDDFDLEKLKCPPQIKQELIERRNIKPKK